MNPQQLLQGEVPHLIDEWQLAPKLWDAVRYEVDQRDEFGQFILTGSAVPPDVSEISHTGTGRISSLLMRPMTLYETDDSTGEVSLRALFSLEHEIRGTGEHSIDDIAFLILNSEKQN
jgi:predicted AAA+ superfamily ATPase